MRFASCWAVLFGVLAVLLPGGGQTASAATRDVCAAGCAHDSIQAAIDAAVPGDTVLVRDGRYFERIAITKALTVRSANGPDRTVIDGQSSGSVVTFAPGVGSDTVLEGFGVTAGSASLGGGLFVGAASPTVRSCIVFGNSATVGGGIFAAGAGQAARISDCQVIGNRADNGGGVAMDGASPVIERCRIAGNEAASVGGGVFFLSGAAGTVSRSTVSGNRASYGGGVYVARSGPTFTESVIGANRAAQGGGMSIEGDGATPAAISRCTISGNRADEGGGVFLASTAATVADSVLSGNAATLWGGGIFLAAGSPIVRNSAITRNVAGHGGGLAGNNGCAGRVLSCTVSANRGTISGGGLFLQGAPLRVSATRIAGNETVGYGGGVLNDGSAATYVNCLIDGNKSGRRGGGMSCGYAPAPTITACTFSGNLGAEAGGALDVAGGIAPRVTDCILWGDGILGGPGGTEVSVEPGSAPVFARCDIAGGWGGAGSGNIDRNPRFLLRLPASAAPTAAGDYRLQSGSPCINAGAAVAGLTSDLEGDPRPQKGRFDIGADEVGLLANGYLEGTAALPAGWAGSGLGSLDRRVADVVRDGRSAFRFAGGPGSKRLAQRVAVAGAAGRRLILRGWAKAQGASGSGGAYGVELRVGLAAGGTRSFWLTFPKRTHDWRLAKRSFAMPAAFTSAEVVLHYDRQLGKAWFDGVELLLL